VRLFLAGLVDRKPLSAAAFSPAVKFRPIPASLGAIFLLPLGPRLERMELNNLLTVRSRALHASSIPGQLSGVKARR